MSNQKNKAERDAISLDNWGGVPLRLTISKIDELKFWKTYGLIFLGSVLLNRPPMRPDNSQEDSKRKRQGQIDSSDDRDICKSQTARYYRSHWSRSIKTLLGVPVFKERVLGCLPADNPSILHVDFGCGPGTVSRAITDMLYTDMLYKDACLEIKFATIGHDHNRHMPDIAREEIPYECYEKKLNPEVFRFQHDWNAFQQDIQSHIKQKWHAVWITANFLFGQDTFEDADAEKIVETINSIVEGVSRATRIHLFGVHPKHRNPEERWRSIAQRTKAEIIFEESINMNQANAKWACICEVQR